MAHHFPRDAKGPRAADPDVTEMLPRLTESAPPPPSPRPSQGFPTNPGLSGSHLPDFKPKGMSRSDKVLAWIMAFIVVFFALGTVNHFTQTATVNSAKASPSATSTAKSNHNSLAVKLSSTDKWYVDAYASLHHVSEAEAVDALIKAGIKAQK